MARTITNISVGIVEGKVAWVVHYAEGWQDSFALHLPIARQFMQGLQELVLLLEHQEASAREAGSAFIDGVGMSDTVSVRLSPPTPEE